MNKPQIVVITPTYNRGKYLERLYDSLNEQESYNFEWLIVDDGSTDDTEVIVSEFIKEEKNFNIVYKKKDNGGKHTALNYAIDYINGDLVFIVDSDDIVNHNCISTINRYWIKYKEINPSMYIFQRASFENRNINAAKYGNKKVIISTLYNLTNNGLHGDHAEVYDLSLFKNYKFPEFKNEKFFSESYKWQLMGFEGPAIYIEEIIYICDYLKGGLTKSGRKLRASNPYGGREFCKVYLDKKFNLAIRYKHALLYNYYSNIIRDNRYEDICDCNKVIIRLARIPSLVLSMLWK